MAANNGDEKGTRTMKVDKRQRYNPTANEWRLLRDLSEFTTYCGQAASEETIRTALAAGIVKTVGNDNNLRPLVGLDSRGIRCIRSGNRSRSICFSRTTHTLDAMGLAKTKGTQWA